MKVFIIGGLVSDGIEEDATARLTLERTCAQLGACLAAAGHHIALCSPFGDSADVQVLRGLATGGDVRERSVAFHFVNLPEAHRKLDELETDLNIKVTRIPYPAPRGEGTQSLQYAWLLCQLGALESTQVTVAVGGRSGGAANLLLQLAEARGKAVVPWPFLGGAAGLAFERRRYELADRLGAYADELYSEAGIRHASQLVELMAASTAGLTRTNREAPSIFISYARGRHAEADFVETLLRRRNQRVFRDDSHFGAGDSIPAKIREAIFKADIFVALWSKEYACSPWCFDEMELALDRRYKSGEKGGLALWILRLDDTRIVPPRARDLLFRDAFDRSSLADAVKDLVLSLAPELRSAETARGSSA